MRAISSYPPATSTQARRAGAACCAFLLAAALGGPAAAQTGDQPRRGHSRHGDAFDIGPRQKPWVIEGIGRTHFPITTRNPEVQRWFDQGHTLLHHFWYYEAERAFRWCLKLEPDNAMAYWGLARAAEDQQRGRSSSPRRSSARPR